MRVLLWMPLAVFADTHEQNQDFLNDDWGMPVFVSEPLVSESIKQDTSFNIVDFTSVKVKGDLAYADDNTLSIARANARFLSEGSPLNKLYLKSDFQLNYFNTKDDLIIESDGAEYSAKINELWAQYSHQSCNGKLGRQGLFWGSVEGTGSLDLVSPFDLTEPLLTDFSLIRRPQDILNISCFKGNVDAEIFFIPNPLMNLLSVRQTSELEDLEETLNPEWGGKLSYHGEGLDLSIYIGRFYDNTPKFIFDLSTQSLAGIYTSQFELYGFGLVYAIDRLLIELDASYQQELKHVAAGALSDSAYLKNKEFNKRNEVSLGFEYTTSSNHILSSGIWFYDYESDIFVSKFEDTFLLNLTWSKQYLNDDLSLSALVLWQKKPESYQFSFLSKYLINDFWSTSTALSYRYFKLNSLESNQFSSSSELWTIQQSIEYQF